MFLKLAFALLLLAQAGWPQGAIHLKTRSITPGSPSRGIASVSATGAAQHYLILFASYPGADVLAELQTRRALVLAYVPENGLMVSAVKLDLRGMDVLWAGPMDPADKISPMVSNQPSGSYLVIFQPDTDAAADNQMAENLGFSVIANSHLLAGQLLVSGAYSALPALAALDAVAYILPASAELQNGDAIASCAGANTPFGPAPQYVKADNGWSKDANGQVALVYYFDSLTTAVPESQVRSEIARAFAAWTKVANVTITPATQPAMNRSIDILFARYAHGDAYPFNGPGGVIAHTFYPVPGNPEPLAGDMHLNADESWSVGGTLDIFSVALHEAGHALGLGHSDDPTSVMYPYYRLQTGLTPDDIAGIQALYGAPDATTTAPPPASAPPASTPPASSTPASTNSNGSTGADTTPPALTITSPGSSIVSVSAATISVNGTASDNVGVASVTWTTSGGDSGVAIGTNHWSATIPLLVGNNTATIKAYDAAGNSSWRAVTVVRTQ
jgi:Matrixin/Glucodextranase, domain B